MLREAYAVYVRKCWHKRIVAEKTFERLKPRNIWTVQETLLCGARCEYCANFGKSRDALIACGMKGIPRNHAESIEVTWCPFRKDSQDVTSCFKNGTSDEVTSRFKNDGVTSHLKNIMCEVTSHLKKVQHDLPKKKCVQRRCPMCGVTKYE